MLFKRQDFLLSALASYIRQTAIATKRAVLQAYQENPEITEKFLQYFDLKFNPQKASAGSVTAMENEIDAQMPKNTALKAVFRL